MMFPTRDEAECVDLANRQRKGEDLGFSEVFVAMWATVPVKGAPAAKKPSAPPRVPQKAARGEQ